MRPCRQEAWPRQLEKVLNRFFGCDRSEGAALDRTRWRHRIANHCVPSKDAGFFQAYVEQRVAANDPDLMAADLILVELGANDVIVNEGTGREPAYVVEQTELLARQLLRLPRKPLVVWVELWQMGSFNEQR